MTRYSRFERLKITLREHGVLDVQFCFPGPDNRYDPRAHREMSEVWPLIDNDPDVRAVVMRGQNGNLCGGAVRETIMQVTGDWPTTMQVHKETLDIILNIINCRKPIVSAIEGLALGGALSAAVVADISVAGVGATLLDRHTQIGVAAGDGAAIIWPLLCGMAKAKYYLLTGAGISGAEAERIGLVSVCARDEDVVSTAFSIAERLACSPFGAIVFTKQALNGWLRQAQPTFELSTALEYVTFGAPDVKAALEGKAQSSSTPFDLPVRVS